MNMKWTRIFNVTTILMLIVGTGAGQTSGAANELWPIVKASIGLWPKTRLDLYAAKQDGEDLARVQKKFGVMGSYRMKRLVRAHLVDIDDDKNYILVLG